MTSQERLRMANHVSIVTIIFNALLSAGKLAVGLLCFSAALVADAMHSLSDVLSTFVVMFGVRMGAREADNDHPYGHEKMEAMASSVLALFLLAVGLYIGVQGILSIPPALSGETEHKPTWLAAIAAFVSIVVKEWMYRYTNRAAGKIDSTALLADAWHHRSDAFSSVGSLIGIVGALLGVAVLDPLASIVIAGFIVQVAIAIFRSAVNQTVDASASAKDEGAIRALILETPGVFHIDELKTRQHANRLYVDVELSVDSSLSLCEAHDIAEQVHKSIEAGFPQVKHCMVHINPDNHEDDPEV